MKNNNIPVINQKFDFFTFYKVLKKSIWIILINLILAIIIGLLYIRYTAPVYQSKSILQVKTQNKTEEILKIENTYESGLSPIIELLRSNEFLKQSLSTLPLDISYYRQGTFLSHELYKNSPFTLDFKLKNTQIYDIPVYLDFKNDEIHLSYDLNSRTYDYKINPNEWKDIKVAEIKINVANSNQISDYQSQIKKGGYYFTINSEKKLVENYSKRLNIKILNKEAGTIEISFSDKSPAKTSDVVNTISSEFIHYEVEQKKESTRQIIHYINKQLGIISTQLDSTEKALKKYSDKEFAINKDNPFATQMGSKTGKSLFPDLTSRLNEYENEEIKLEFEIKTLKKLEKEIKSSKDVNVYELIAILSGTRSEGFVESMLNSMLKLYDKRNELLNNVTENNHKIKTIDNQIETKKKQVLNYLNVIIKRLEQNRKNYSEKVKEIRAEISKPGTERGIEYARLKRLHAINQNFFNQLITKKAEYMISQAGFVSNNIILEKATTPSSPIKPSKKNIIFLVIIIAIFVSLIIILIRYLFYNKITNIQEIANFTDIPIIGAIPLYKNSTKLSQLLVNKHPKSVLAEAFRNVRANMEFLSDTQKASVISISSTISGEGKTFVGINLSGILAMTDKKVVLIDLDLRKPKLDNIFSIDSNKGISTIMINKNKLEECIYQTEIDSLHVIPSGPVPPNPSELILTKNFSNFLEELKKEYDFIVIDTPPVGIVTDALPAFELSDYTFYITRANQSPRTFISYINNLAENKNLKNFGLILNGIDDKAGKYGYGYGYNYGYTNGYNKTSGYRDYTKSNDYYEEPKKEKRKKLKLFEKLFKKLKNE